MHNSGHNPMCLYHLEKTVEELSITNEHMTSVMPPRSTRPTGGGYAE
jgi:hypothetical protein